MDQQRPVVGFEEVHKHEERLVEMRARIGELKEEEEGLAQEIATKMSEGQWNVDELRARRAEARAFRADLTEAAELVEQRLGSMREQAGYSEAQRRVKGIARAFGSVHQELADDEAKVREAATSYVKAVGRINERFLTLAKLRAEAGALADRFAVDAPKLAPVVAPARREGCVAAHKLIDGVGFADHAHITPATEECEHHIRRRRTYREVEGSEAFRIITEAHLVAFPELTERQCEFVEDRVRQKKDEVRTMDRFGAEAARSLQRSGLG